MECFLLCSEQFVIPGKNDIKYVVEKLHFNSLDVPSTCAFRIEEPGVIDPQVEIQKVEIEYDRLIFTCLDDEKRNVYFTDIEAYSSATNKEHFKKLLFNKLIDFMQNR